MENKIKKAAEFIKKNNNFCFLCHKRLDGDTLGAAYSLYYACLILNKNSVVKTYEDEVSQKFSFIYPEKDVVEEFEIEHYVSVDVADLNLLEESYKNKKISLCIDHHETNRIEADLKCVDEKSAATCEIVYFILKELGVKINKKIADCLYLGISTDTGCFKYQNVTQKTHKIAADLIEFGADFYNINLNAFDKKSKNRLKLEAQVIKNLKYYFEDRLVVVFITKDIINSSGASLEDCGSVSYIAASFEDALVSITAKEEKNGFKISVRTKGFCNASLFCRRFNGGGHKKAAGCFIEGEKEEVLEKLLKASSEEFKFVAKEAIKTV